MKPSSALAKDRRAAAGERSANRSGSLLTLLRDVLRASRRERKLWLAPLLLFLMLLGGLLALISLTGPLAPFIYPIM